MRSNGPSPVGPSHARAGRLPLPTETEPDGVHHRAITAGEGFHVGEFRCEARSGAWKQENQIGPNHLLAFATVPVGIRHAGGERRIADRTRVMLYNPGQLYERGLEHPEGDRCVFIGLSETLAGPFAAELNRSTTPDRFDRDHAPVSERAWVLLRRLAQTPDPALAEERVIGLLQTIADASPAPGRSPGQRATTVAAHRDLAEAARAALARSPESNDSLAALARRLHSSPFHLARVFRAHTGRSIIEQRRTLRARAALEMLLDSDLPIAVIADRVGYACHAQFSAAFRQVFGRSPRNVRTGSRSA